MTEETEIYDNDDRSFGSWYEICTPAKMKRWTEARLFACITENGGGQFSRMAESELARRRNLELKTRIESLTDATHLVVVATDDVKQATRGVQKEVAILAASSEKLETLTIKLNNLTWTLIVLTALAVILAVVTPIGIEVWKAQHSETPSPQTAPAPEPPKPSP